MWRWRRGVGMGVLALGGCVLSVSEIVPTRESRQDDRLLGTWVAAENDERALISARRDGDFDIAYRDEKGNWGRFRARLGRLGPHDVLDVSILELDRALQPPYEGMVVGAHLLLVVKLSGDSLDVSLLEPDSVQAALRDRRLTLAHDIAGDRLLLTEPTAPMQSQLAQFIARPGVLSEWSRWRRTSQSVDLPPPAPDDACVEGTSWAEADALFRRDRYWRGGDAASSVDLGGGRILWLFADSFIDAAGRGTRSGATMVSNSVAIQVGANPESASISFYWGQTSDGRPAAFIPDRRDESLWMGNGVRVADRLVLFMARVRRGGGGLGFESVGWTAVMVENPDAPPAAWRVRALETPANPLGVLVGFAAVLRLDEHVYAFGSQDPVKSHPLFVARWRAADVQRGELRAPEWWAGERLGWVPDSSDAPRQPLFEQGQSELGIHRDSATGRFIALQTQVFGASPLAARFAPALTGPWTSPRVAFEPPEMQRPNVMIYAAKLHPYLTGPGLVATYATNSGDFGELVRDESIYFPRFLTLQPCRQ